MTQIKNRQESIFSQMYQTFRRYGKLQKKNMMKMVAYTNLRISDNGLSMYFDYFKQINRYI